MRWFDRALDLLFPPKCPFCGKIVEHPAICGGCREALSWTEGEESLREISQDLSCAAPLRYEGLARQGLLAFKFQGRSGAAAPLGELVAQCAAEQFSGEFDTVTWVPVSRKRLKQRGYDQAELLARAACRLWDTAPRRLLVKHTHNPAQSGISGIAARRANVQGVYEAAAAGGKRILLIDDICTTGATLEECAKALRQAGAEAVFCAVVALAGGEKTAEVGKSIHTGQE